MTVWRDSSARGAGARLLRALPGLVILAGVALLIFTVLRWAARNPPDPSIGRTRSDGPDYMLIPRMHPLGPRFDDFYLVPMAIGGRHGA